MRWSPRPMIVLMFPFVSFEPSVAWLKKKVVSKVSPDTSAIRPSQQASRARNRKTFYQ